jgi:hypothetical protein
MRSAESNPPGCLPILLVIGVIGLVGSAIGDLFDGGDDEGEGSSSSSAPERKAMPEVEWERRQERAAKRERDLIVGQATRELKALGGWGRWGVRRIERTESSFGVVSVFTELYPKPSNDGAVTGICVTLLNPVMSRMSLDRVDVWGFDGRELVDMSNDDCWA